MRKFCVTGGLVVGLLAYATIACAAPTINYADSVVSYTNKIQNYGEEKMTDSTTWWVTGESDADADGNGYAWDAGDPDYVAGWRAGATNQYITVKFDVGLPDVIGDDLVIHLYSGGKANASVWASTNGDSYINIGSIGSGTPGYFRDEVFDFDAFGLNDVHYVKVNREAVGSGTGMFFDSFASTAVPEPTTFALLALGGLLVAARWMVVRRRRVN